MFDLEEFTLTQMTEIGPRLRRMGEGAHSMEETAGRIVSFLYEQFLSKSNQQKQCALVRFFKTHPYVELDEAQRIAAASMLGGLDATPAMKCMVLLATAGEKPEWNSRLVSVGHKAIPLPSEKAIEAFPMISRLVSQLGLTAHDLCGPDAALMVSHGEHNFNVFYVPDALGSPYVPAQAAFVVPYQIKSVLGFGGALPSADIFAVIMFSRVPIDRQTAELFKTLALSVKLAMIPFSDKVFDNSTLTHAVGRNR